MPPRMTHFQRLATINCWLRNASGFERLADRLAHNVILVGSSTADALGYGQDASCCILASPGRIAWLRQEARIFRMHAAVLSLRPASGVETEGE